MFKRQRRKFLKLCEAGGNVERGMESVIELTCKVDVKYHRVGEEEKIDRDQRGKRSVGGDLTSAC